MGSILPTSEQDIMILRIVPSVQLKQIFNFPRQYNSPVNGLTNNNKYMHTL